MNTQRPCMKMKNFSLLSHQIKVVNFILHPENRGIIVYHSVGSGKTLTALVAAKCLVNRYPGKRVVVVTPASLVGNFEKEIKKTGIYLGKNLIIESYQKFTKKRPSVCHNSILILDESHNLNAEKGVTFNKIFECSQNAFKIILLSATPVKNKPEEIANQLSLLTGYKIPKSRVASVMDLPNGVAKAKKLVDLFKCKISIFSNEDKEYYPSVKEKIVELVMSPEYYNQYYKIQQDIKVDLPKIYENTRDLTKFFNGIRRAVNKVKLTSPKIEWTIHKINESVSKDKKILIYSNWLDAGINIIRDYLKENGIPFSTVTGSLSKEAKDTNVKNYNSGKTKVMLITASGSEGLDLKGTRTLIILEPHWNETRIKQVIGRAVRYKSHFFLPVADRSVDVYRLILKKPEHKKKGDGMGSGDEILFKLSHSKEKLIEDFYKYIALLSVEKDSSCF